MNNAQEVARHFCRADPRIDAAATRTVSDLQATIMRIARHEDLDFDFHAVNYRQLLNDLAPKDTAPFDYRRLEIQDVIDAGPQDDEDWFRLQVSGKAKSKHLNITAAELATIRDLLSDA